MWFAAMHNTVRECLALGISGYQQIKVFACLVNVMSPSYF